jgi:hypothetical protein
MSLSSFNHFTSFPSTSPVKSNHFNLPSSSFSSFSSSSSSPFSSSSFSSLIQPHNNSILRKTASESQLEVSSSVEPLRLPSSTSLLQCLVSLFLMHPEFSVLHGELYTLFYTIIQARGPALKREV